MSEIPITNCRINNCEKRLLVATLREAERFMAYFANETDGVFVGPGTPQTCLEQIRSALRQD